MSFGIFPIFLLGFVAFMAAKLGHCGQGRVGGRASRPPFCGRALIALVGFLPCHAAAVLIALVGSCSVRRRVLIALVGHGFERTLVRLPGGKLLAGKLLAGNLLAGKLPAGNQTPVRPARAHAQRTDAHTSVALCIGSVSFLVQTPLVL